MAMKKKIFSDRRKSGEAFFGGRRRSLSFPELEERKSPRGSFKSRLQKVLPERASRRVGKIRTIHVVMTLVCAAVLAFLIWFFFFLFPSPIGGLTPAPNTFVRNSKVNIKATLDRPAQPEQLKLEVDGKDFTTKAAVFQNKKGITYTAGLSDGRHQTRVTLKGGGLMGNRTAAWSFTVDTTPPNITIKKKSVSAVKGTDNVNISFSGETGKGAVVKVEDRRLPVDTRGRFSGTTTASRSGSLEITAADKAGNVAHTYIVTQQYTDAKGLHVSIYIASSDTDLAKLIGLVERTELNALEVDLKDESGQIGFALDNDLAKKVGSTTNLIKLDACVDQVRYNNIYTICRIVTFKDPKLAKGRPDLAVQDKYGGPWSTGVWLDPYSKEVWDYNLSVAVAAAKAGFNEIQFDYMRFPSDGNTATCLYTHKDNRTPGEVIDDFMGYAREKLAPYNVFISADLFGLTASKQGEMGIGQKVRDVAKRVDFISPMVYPSHYNPGEYNIKEPEANPGDTVTKSIDEFKKVMAGTQAKLRPWLQDFSLRVTYTPPMVRRQIDATQAAGVNQWLLWDPDCTYSEAALRPKTNKPK